jgi:hypothetical protein
MKIGGVQVTTCEELIVLYRGGPGKDIPIRARAVAINDVFNKLVPVPVPPMVLKKGGVKESDLADKDYKAALSHRDNLRFAYLILRSLEPSNIEWEIIDMEKPSTWLKWSDELLESGLSDKEVQRVVDAVMVAGSLSEAKLEEARAAFLRGQEA